MIDFIKSLLSNDSTQSMMRAISFLLVLSGIALIFIAYFQKRIDEATRLGMPMIAYGVGGKVGQKTVEFLPFILEKIFKRGNT